MPQTKKYLVDTNVALNYPEILQKEGLVVTSSLLRELEKIEVNKDKYGERSYLARQARRYIKANKNRFHMDLKDYQWTRSDELDTNYEDNRILEACIQNNYSLLTMDGLLAEKAMMYDVEWVDVESELSTLGQQNGNDYTGIHKVYLSVNNPEEEIILSDLYEKPEINTYNLLTNQYLIVYDKDVSYIEDGEKVFKVLDKFRFDGEKHIKLKLPDKKVIRPKNEEQACALDLLMNPSIPIKIVTGGYGSGKTMCAVKMALYHVLEKGNQSKIMVLRNPIGSGESIGWLKGSKEDKTGDFFKPIIQHLSGGEQEAQILETRGQLIKEIPYYIKGLSIEDTFVLADEAEDLDTKLFKLIGSRLGQNSAIVFTGDYKQAEDKFKTNNGLLAGVQMLKGNPLVGIVQLSKDVRSDASKVFTEM